MTDGEFKFVTHCGVWWKVYLDSNYLEDFPYCPCCDSPRKLVQTEWNPNEKFECPIAGTEVQLMDDGFPQKLERIHGKLYESYFGGDYITEIFSLEFSRLKELHPRESEFSLLGYLFQTPPFNRLRNNEKEKILHRFNTQQEVLTFLLKNPHYYRRLLRKKGSEST